MSAPSGIVHLFHRPARSADHIGPSHSRILLHVSQNNNTDRPVARGGSGGRTTPPQLPIPKILFHPLAILFHLSTILFHPSAILFHPSAILFHPLAILFHPWNMWMTSHGQCPRGGACECPRVGAFFKLMTSRGQCPRGGGGCAWCSTHPSSDPPHLAGWLRA